MRIKKHEKHARTNSRNLNRARITYYACTRTLTHFTHILESWRSQLKLLAANKRHVHQFSPQLHKKKANRTIPSALSSLTLVLSFSSFSRCSYILTNAHASDSVGICAPVYWALRLACNRHIRVCISAIYAKHRELHGAVWFVSRRWLGGGRDQKYTFAPPISADKSAIFAGSIFHYDMGMRSYRGGRVWNR